MEKNIDTKQTSYSLNETIAGNDTFDSTSIKKFAPVWEKDDEDDNDFYQEKVRSLEEIQQAEHEMFDRVWYSRHKILNDENCKESPYIEGERQAILNIEKKYDTETLIVDDWTIAEWNGKLSALRWVLGDDWDFLDT